MLDNIAPGANEKNLLYNLNGSWLKEISSLGDRFYEELNNIPEARKILKGKDLSRLKELQGKHFLRLLGPYDEDFVRRCRRIGETHARVGVSPKLFLKGFIIYTNLFTDFILKRESSPQRREELLWALNKVFLWHLELSLSAYFRLKERVLRATQREVQRLNRVYEILREINLLIFEEKGRRRLCEKACEVLAQKGDFDLVWIGIKNEKEDQIIPVAASGKTTYLDRIVVRISPLKPEGQGPASKAFREGREIIISDIRKETSFSPWKDEALNHGLRSVMSLPLHIEDTIWGVLLLYHRRPGFFSHRERKLLKEIARDLSLGLSYIARGESLEESLYYDPLTGLANQRALMRSLEHERWEAGARGEKLALICLDIDQFSLFNQTYGRRDGDLILKEISRRLSGLRRWGIEVFRTGADEFALLFSFPKMAQLESHLDRIKGLLETTFKIRKERFTLTISMGLAVFPDDGKDPESLFAASESALKTARKKGTSGFSTYSSPGEGLFESRWELLTLLKEGLKKGWYTLYYQPKIGVKDRRVTGFEALLRLNVPEKGLLSPIKFVPLLEESGLIVPVGEWVLKEACRTIKEDRLGPKDSLVLSINVSPSQLREKGVVERFKEIIEASKINPSRLRLEITESALVEGTEEMIQRLKALADLGIGLSIDDFGTGFSSLAYLKRLPFSYLKIDYAFVFGVPDNREDVDIIRAILDLARNFAKKTVAEGVERREQLIFLSGLGVDEIQGYYFAKPLPEDDARAFLENYTPERYFWKTNP
ncbi:EAL domain-containing protein [Thermosulfuriphilus sp.]